MKKTYFISVLFSLCILPAVGYAATAAMSEHYSGSEKPVTEDLYVLSETATLTGSYNEDVLVLAETITVPGSITRDALLVGRAVSFEGSVGDDVRVAGATVTISGTITGDLFVIAGEFVLLPEARVLGDLYLVAGQAKLLGEVKGNTRVGVGDLQIAGSFGRVDARADKIVVTSTAKISGVLFYKSRHEAVVAEGAAVGEIRFDQVVRPKASFGYLLGTIFSVKVLMMLALGYFMHFVFRETSDKVIVLGVQSFWRECARGLVLLLIMPLVAFALAATVIGLPLAALIGLSYASLSILAWIYGAVLVGAMAEKYARKRDIHSSDVWQVLFGVMIFSIIVIIPVVGWVAAIIVIAAAFGSLAQVLYGFLKSNL